MVALQSIVWLAPVQVSEYSDSLPLIVPTFPFRYKCLVCNYRDHLSLEIWVCVFVFVCVYVCVDREKEREVYHSIG